jgi:hypothetical protein
MRQGNSGNERTDRERCKRQSSDERRSSNQNPRDAMPHIKESSNALTKSGAALRRTARGELALAQIKARRCNGVHSERQSQ